MRPGRRTISSCVRHRWIDALADAFGEFDSPADKVHVVRSPGTLNPATDWANELHPNGDGFRKLVHGPWSEALRASGYVP
jgi:hypothetical protein